MWLLVEAASKYPSPADKVVRKKGTCIVKTCRAQALRKELLRRMTSRIRPELSLSKVEIAVITPSEKVDHPSYLDPSIYDLVAIDAYIPVLFCYRLENSEQAYTRFVDELKRSLSKVLVSYYPLAGRWIKTYDSTIRRLLCTDEGVPFIQTCVDEYEIDDVVDLNDFKPCNLLSGYEFLNLDSTRFTAKTDTLLPPLFVQVTRFKCGSASLCATFCHNSADGKAQVDFMQAWSQTAVRGESSLVPSHDRSLIPVKLSDYIPVPTEKVAVDPGAVRFSPKISKTATKRLRVKKEVIDSWKEEAAEKQIKLTAVDCMSAHLWRAMAMLPDSMPGHFSSSETWVCTFIEGRKKFFQPPLPEHYFGNCMYAYFLPVKDLAEIPDIPSAGSIVHSTVRKVTASTHKEGMGELFQRQARLLDFKGRHLLISSWYRFPLYEIEFGCGKPYFATMNAYNWDFLSLGYCIIEPAPPAADHLAVLHLGFPQDVLEVFQADKEFMALFA